MIIFVIRGSVNTSPLSWHFPELTEVYILCDVKYASIFGEVSLWTSPLSNQQLNPKVTPLDEDQVELTLTLPDDLVQDFLKVLDSLTNLATIVRSKTRLARLKDNSADIAQTRTHQRT